MIDLRLLDMRMQQLPLGSDIWLLGVIGFGLLAGIIPLHGWVPQAHANASAPAAALFSTVVMKIDLPGIKPHRYKSEKGGHMQAP